MASTKSAGPLQALVLADSFDECFRPITLEKPRALLPIAGVPLLNYTIEFLAGAGVREVVVLCSAHADLVEAHIDSLRGKLGVAVKCRKAPKSKNVGDALREIADAEIFHQDFVLVYGDIISNQKLLPVVQQHVLRREKDKNAIMTLLLTKTTEDQELAKTKIPQLYAVLNAGASNNITPSVSSMLPIESAPSAIPHHISQEMKGLDPSSSSEDLATNSSERSQPVSIRSSARSNSVSTPVISSSPGHTGSLETPGIINQTPATLADRNPLSSSSTQASRLGDSSLALTLSSPDSKLLIMDGDTGQVFQYDDRAVSHRAPHVELDTELFKKHQNLYVRSDLQDSGVAICSPDVLLKFTEHFDYKNLSQLVRGVINDELQDLKIFASIADPKFYTSRVSSLRKYHQVSLDVLKRWTFPMVPDSNILPGTSWNYARPGVYKEQKVHLHRDCTVGVNTAIGESSSLASGTQVSHATIGRNCKIGQKVKIKHSFIWDNVTIEDDCVLDHVIVCSGATIKKGTTLSPGCVIGYNVVVGAGIVLPPLTKLSAVGQATKISTPAQTSAQEDFDAFTDDESGDYSEDDSNPDTDVTKPDSYLKDIDLGVGGVGRKWTHGPLPFLELCTGWETALHVKDVIYNVRQSEVTRVAVQTESTAAESGITDLQHFSNEVQAIVAEHAKKFNSDNFVLEVNSLKFAHDKSFLECAASIVTGIFELVDTKAIRKSTKTLLNQFKPVFPKFLDTVDDHVELLFEIESYCEQEGNEEFAKEFATLLNFFYELEILKEEAFLQWAEEHEEDEKAGESSALYRKSKQFIEWLKDAEEEEEEEEESDEE